MSNKIENNNPNYLTIEKAGKFLHANPQLKSLDIGLDPFVPLNSIINGNPLIFKLKISNMRYSFRNVTADELNRFASEHPFIVELNLRKYKFTANDVDMFVRQLNH